MERTDFSRWDAEGAPEVKTGQGLGVCHGGGRPPLCPQVQSAVSSQQVHLSAAHSLHYRQPHARPDNGPQDPRRCRCCIWLAACQDWRRNYGSRVFLQHRFTEQRRHNLSPPVQAVSPSSANISPRKTNQGWRGKTGVHWLTKLPLHGRKCEGGHCVWASARNVRGCAREQ